MKKSRFMAWVDQQIAARPAIQAEVDAALAALRVEEALVRFRERRGVSQAALAQRLGVSQPAIARLESGRVRNLELRTLQRYVLALGGRLKLEIVPASRRRRRPARVA
jgi:predicted transcriptional regulator